MKISIINHAIAILQSELSTTAELESASFFEGAFSVFASQKAQGKLDEAMFKNYLSEFLMEDGIARDTLSKVNGQLLQDLEEMLETTSFK
jgi:hypothetical protein